MQKQPQVAPPGEEPSIGALAQQLSVQIPELAKQGARRTVDRATDADGRPRPEVLAASVGLLSAVAVVLVLAAWWRRR